MRLRQKEEREERMEWREEEKKCAAERRASTPEEWKKKRRSEWQSVATAKRMTGETREGIKQGHRTRRSEPA